MEDIQFVQNLYKTYDTLFLPCHVFKSSTSFDIFSAHFCSTFRVSAAFF